jgi:hypothetical protein
VINLSVGQEDMAERCFAPPRSRVKRWIGFDLQVNVRCGVDESPGLAPSADGKRSVKAGLGTRLPGSHTPAQLTGAVPLGVPTPCGCPQKA